jgi:hypothetical protein
VLPPHLQDLLSGVNNLLNYIAGMVTIWMDIMAGNAPPLSCYLSNSDSSSTIGRLVV